MSESPVKKLDCRGDQCPLPILKTKKEIQTIGIGEILEVWSTDPGSKEDFPRWAERTGNQLLKVEEKNGYWVYLIKRLK